MTDIKFMANKRLRIALGLVAGNPFVNPEAATVAEANALLNATPATRINGYSFGLQASGMSDDRSFADEASAQSRQFDQFGGDIPFYLPTDYLDTSDILQKVFTLIKRPGDLIWVMTRLGALQNATFKAGEFVNLYKAMTDGSQANTEGTAGGVVVVTFLPQGDVYPLMVLAPAVPVAVTAVYPTTAIVGLPIWPAAGALYQGVNITGEATYSSSDNTVLVHEGHGIFMPIAAGSASPIVTFPGAAPFVPVPVTITAA